MKSNITIFWFRQDLRLMDNPGLAAAISNGPIIPIYILGSGKAEDFTDLGSASKWWLHHSLFELNKSLDHQLNFFIGDPIQIILDLLKDNNIGSVYWNRCYEPFKIKTDTELKLKLKDLNIDCKSFNGSLLWEPWEILKSDGSPYKVYTPFYRNGCLKGAVPRKPLSLNKKDLKIAKLNDKSKKLRSNLDQLKLLPKINWDQQMSKIWNIGEHGAQLQLKKFLHNGLIGYKNYRNYPAKPNVSKLSPYLHFGEISVNQIWYDARNYMEMNEDLDHFLSELGWREFSYYLLYHFPNLPTKNFQSKFDKFSWSHNKKLLKAWQTGSTGYPIVDAGMRELWQTGYIHNRVRMVVGSFLVKNLLLHWHEGQKWFWDCLVDADLANNSASWQWVAGSGADAAPYFRIFNPITQGEKFDQEGTYTKYFIPELGKLPAKYLFKPWEAPKDILNQAGIVLGKTYPKPIVSLEVSRNKALQTYQSLSSQ